MGACMLVRREAVEQVGPLDESFFLFSEETDWCQRFREAGWKVLFYPGAECVHVGGASHGGRMFRENVRGHLRFLVKHRGVRYAERARRVLRVALRLRGRLFRDERGRMYREAADWLGSGPVPELPRPMTLLRLALATGILFLPGAVVVEGARAARRGCHARLVARAPRRRAGGDVPRRRVADADARPAARRGRRRAPVLVARAPVAANPGLGLGARRGRRARHPALARGGRDRRRRALPPRAGAEARRVRLALARRRQRVRRRRPPSRVRLPALARVPRARRASRVRRSVRSSSCTRPRCSRRWRCSWPTRPATRSSAASGLRSRSSARRSLSPRSRPPTVAPTPRSASPPPRRASCCFPPRWRSRSRTWSGRRAACSPPPPPRGSSSPSSTRRTRSSSGSPFAGFLVVRSLVERREAGRIAAALAALVVPAAAYFAWLLPVVRDTASYAPGEDELERAFEQYAGQLDVFSETSYRLAPEVFGRAGAVAVAALLLVPLAGLALRRRWAAYVLGGFLAVAAVMLASPLFVAFSDVVSISQSRRAAGFWPLAFAFAGGLAVLAALLRVLLLPAALAGGIALQLLYPGDFGYRLDDGGPALVTWFAVGGGAVALALRPLAPALDREADGDRRSRGGALRPPDRAPRCRELEPVRGAAAEPAHAGADRGAARRRPVRRHGLLRPRDELPDRCLRARLHRRCAAEPRRRHRGEPAVRAARRERALLRDRRPRHPAPGGRRVARRRSRPLRDRPAGRQRLPGRPLHALRAAVASSA